MLKVVTERCCKVGVCGSCLDARGITETELADWNLWADKVLVF